VFFVNADDKGLAGVLCVNADSKRLTLVDEGTEKTHDFPQRDWMLLKSKALLVLRVQKRRQYPENKRVGPCTVGELRAESKKEAAGRYEQRS
jgi:hypothetical protein